MPTCVTDSSVGAARPLVDDGFDVADPRAAGDVRPPHARVARARGVAVVVVVTMVVMAVVVVMVPGRYDLLLVVVLLASCSEAHFE